MFRHHAWAVGSYSSGPQAGTTPKIQVNPTILSQQMDLPVDLHETYCWSFPFHTMNISAAQQIFVAWLSFYCGNKLQVLIYIDPDT